MLAVIGSLAGMSVKSPYDMRYPETPETLSKPEHSTATLVSVRSPLRSAPVAVGARDRKKLY